MEREIKRRDAPGNNCEHVQDSDDAVRNFGAAIKTEPQLYRPGQQRHSARHYVNEQPLMTLFVDPELAGLGRQIWESKDGDKPQANDCRKAKDRNISTEWHVQPLAVEIPSEARGSNVFGLITLSLPGGMAPSIN